MEGVPTNALAEWKARKESEAGTAAMAAAAAASRPRHSYTVIPEADLQAALAQHKALMAQRDNPAPKMPFPPFAGAPPFLPPGMPPPGYVQNRFEADIEASRWGSLQGLTCPRPLCLRVSPPASRTSLAWMFR